MMTATKLRDKVVETALSQVGYVSGNYNVSKYGVANNWRSKWLWGTQWQGMYCNRNLSWDVDQVMGARAGIVAVGRQSGTPLPVGFAATWLQREWFRANNCHVGFANSQPGDYYLYKLPGRQTNPTNHVGMFYRWHVPGKIAIVIEGNLAKPGYGTSTIGVHLHYREIKYVVGVYRPRWAAAAVVYNQEFPPKEEELMSDEQYNRLRAMIDEIPEAIAAYRNPGYPERDVHGLWRDAARARELEKEVKRLQDQLNVVNRTAAAARDETRALLETKLDFGTTTSVGKTFPKGLTVRQALGYAAAGSMQPKPIATEAENI